MSPVRPPLDPEIAVFVERMQRAWARHPPIATLSPPEARAVAEEVRRPWREGGPEMARISEHHIPTRSGDLRIRLYDPGVATPAPALAYMHGDGFLLFSINTHDRLMREYAAAARCLVIGVDYPLSPEHLYPVALDRIVDLVGWLRGPDAAGLGLDGRIALGGDSAGANLALSAALRLRDRGETDRIKALLLNYGAFGAPCSDEAEARFGGPGSVLDRAEMEFYFDSYLGGVGRGHDVTDPYARPILADLRDLPPTLLVVPECDLLAEQNLEMNRRMQASGVDVSANIYAGATHSFLEAMAIAGIARQAIADSAAFIKRELAARRP